MTTLTLNNGFKIPVVGLGTYETMKGATDAQKTETVVYEAIKLGYRHIDCAYIYMNEEEIGNAIQKAIQEGIVKREELFITTKLWCSYFATDDVKKCCDMSLSALKLDYIDLYLIHWPIPFQGELTFDVTTSKVVLQTDVTYMDAWKGMEKLVDEGCVRSIGVSNFNCRQVKNVLDNCRIKPVINQIESHPYLNNSKLIEFCLAHNVAVTAYCPLGTPANANLFKKSSVSLIDNPVVKKIAEKYGKSSAQILIRFQIDRGVTVIPKTLNFNRLKENMNVFDFKLTTEDISQMNALEREDGRLVSMLECSEHPEFPFNES